MARSVERLLRLDPAGLSRDERLDALAKADALVARASAVRERLLASVNDPGDEKNWVREEVGCLLRWPFAVAADRLARASHLVERLPRTLGLHAAGQVSADHVRVIVEATFGLDAVTIAEIEDRVLPRAGTQTRAVFRASVRRAVLAADPHGADRRHRVAVMRDKTVRLHPLPDGMAGIWSVHTAVQAEAMLAALRRLAGDAAPPGDVRSADARRADVLADCVLGADRVGAGAAAGGGVGAAAGGGAGSGAGAGGNTGGGSGRASARVLVHIHVPLDGPPELIGHGPIPNALCRTVMADPETRVQTVPVDEHGVPVPPAGVDDHPDSRYPSAALERHVTTTWRTCRFPGCNRRAVTCERDHIDPFNGHNTVAANLQPLCLRHHHAKHDAGWHVTRYKDGTTEWISPTGRRYWKPPPDD